MGKATSPAADAGHHYVAYGLKPAPAGRLLSTGSDVPITERGSQRYVRLAPALRWAKSVAVRQASCISHLPLTHVDDESLVPSSRTGQNIDQ